MKIGENAKKDVLEKYSREKQADLYFKIFNKIYYDTQN